MGPGGVTESIVHFAGYLHLFGDYARAHPEYDGRRRAPDAGLAGGSQAHAAHPADLDEMPSQPFRVNIQPAPFALSRSTITRLHRLHGPSNLPHIPIHTWDSAPVLPDPGAAGGVLLDGDQSLDRSPVPDQALISVTQVNVMNNNDVVLMVSGTNVTRTAQSQGHGAFPVRPRRTAMCRAGCRQKRQHRAKRSPPSRRMMPRCTEAIWIRPPRRCSRA